MRHVFALSLLLAFASAGMASAQTKTGMLDYSKRLSLATIGTYAYEYAGQDADPTTTPGKEFAVGLQGQYLLNPMLTLTAGSLYHLDTKQVRSFLGISMPFYGKDRPQAELPPSTLSGY
jgi:hypothetical protein